MIGTTSHKFGLMQEELKIDDDKPISSNQS